MNTLRRTASVFVFALLLNAPLAFAGMEEHVSQKALEPLSSPVAIGGKVRLENFPLDNKTETLELERFEVFADNVEIKVFGENRKVLETLPKPDMKFYRGRLASDPDSLVFMSLSPGRVDGLVYKGERRFSFISRPHMRKEAATVDGGFDVFVDDTSSYEETTDAQGFVCELDKKPMVGRPRMTSQSINGLPGEQQTDGAISGNGKWLLYVAIDTDFELYTNVSSSSGNVTTYIGNLVGAASAIYSRDLSTDLQISYTGIQTTSSDPFTVVPGSAGTWNGNPTTFSTQHALAELGDYWHATPPSAAAHASSILVSGKSQLAGVAWIATICTSDFLCQSGNCGDPLWDGHYGGKYAYCGGIFPPVGLAVGQNITPPYTLPASNYWPLLEFTHEFGHNVQSVHTHCIVMSPGDQTLYGRTYVDNCANEGGCFNGTNVVPAEKGTIMSYCHLRPGGGPNSRYTFGLAGEASHVVPENMRGAIQTKTPNQPTITAPSSMTSGANANATITPVGGLTYLWQVTNGVINTGQGTSTLNFTATTNPVTVKLTATNAQGCAITNFVTITVTVGGKRGDANGDGIADIFWRHDNGSNFMWQLDANANLAAPLTMETAQPPNWKQVAHGDFDGDGKTDIFWREPNGGNFMWLLNGSVVANRSAIQLVDPAWSVIGSGDFNGDGKADILWRHTNGTPFIWLMNGFTIIGSGGLQQVDNNWQLYVSGDITGDGKADIILRHQGASGSNYLWTMDGVAITAATPMEGVPDTAWYIEALVDLNGDGRSDIFWRRTTGDTFVWLLSGPTVINRGPLDPVSDTNWKVVAVGDFDGNGTGDIFWRHQTTGGTFVWQMNGITKTGGHGIQTIDTAWKIVGAK